MIDDFDATPENSFLLQIGEQHTPVRDTALQYIQCYSTDETVVTVDDNGEVSAVGTGTAHIVFELESDGQVQLYQYHVE